MTPEEKREQLLKRVLPALFVCVIYFVFVSGTISEKAEKAAEDYDKISKKGVSVKSIPNLRNQISFTESQIAKLQKQQKSYRNQLKGMTGFLQQQSSANKSTAQLSALLVRNNIQVIQESTETMKQEDLPKSIKDIRHWLKEAGNSQGDLVNIQHLRLRGRYPDMYSAMLELAKSKFPAVPVKLTMLHPENSNMRPDEQQWDLVLWM